MAGPITIDDICMEWSYVYVWIKSTSVWKCRHRSFMGRTIGIKICKWSDNTHHHFNFSPKFVSTKTIGWCCFDRFFILIDLEVYFYNRVYTRIYIVAVILYYIFTFIIRKEKYVKYYKKCGSFLLVLAADRFDVPPNFIKRNE